MRKNKLTNFKSYYRMKEYKIKYNFEIINTII